MHGFRMRLLGSVSCTQVTSGRLQMPSHLCGCRGGRNSDRVKHTHNMIKSSLFTPDCTGDPLRRENGMMTRTLQCIRAWCTSPSIPSPHRRCDACVMGSLPYQSCTSCRTLLTKGRVATKKGGHTLFTPTMSRTWSRAGVGAWVRLATDVLHAIDLAVHVMHTLTHALAPLHIARHGTPSGPAVVEGLEDEEG